ncbi:hypothetical protein [Persicitalea jodogahamensis]|uniref:Uncharacterized protein n=1 Tax=Persicitalea jodogahamensis TaxID=402147 RepID=A0A8J3D585_9BACT|nr:hypothetical protein [Persicitalea jodogahamensis]GHB85038.1 hypothetical protein GCM10007390_45390 [Persicitalea jodogahamensis]
MKDEEIDDLFRRNADYLADEPVRGFDKDAFWQHLQTELPKKEERRKKPAAWWWAAASVLLAGIFGGIWWMQSPKLEVRTLAEQKTTTSRSVPYKATRPQTRIAEATSQIPAQGSKIEPATSSRRHGSGRRSEMPGERVYKQTIPPETPSPAMVAVELPAAERPIPIILPTPIEVVDPVASEKPAYRVVHINEIRERKQQEARSRSRLAVRVGLPSASQVTTQNDNKPLLNIPIQH